MDIQIEKLGLISWIAQLNDTSVLQKLKRIYNEETRPAEWEGKISLQEKESIERGLKDIEAGRTHSHQTVKKIYEKYL